MTRTIAELQTELAAGRTTSEALTKQALDRINAVDGQGKVVFIKVHAEAALAAARASDLSRKAGLVRSPLEGLPISVKDLFAMAGDVTRAGSIALNDARPATEDAPAIRNLRLAGAVIVGRTNMTEFAFSGLGLNPHYGTPLNPYDRANKRIPGGSSSGAAVSVSDDMAVAGIGTDTGGSVRIPAALCGLTGFKPTADRVSRRDVLPLSTSFNSIGPIANSVACCALLNSVLSGDSETATVRPRAIAGLRLAVPQTVVLDDLDDHVSASFVSALMALSEAGAHVVEIAVPEFAELAAINAKGGLITAEAWHWHRDLIERAGDKYDPRVLARMLRGKDMSAADYIDVLQARVSWIAAVNERFGAFDAVLMPTVPTIAPTIAELANDDDYSRRNMAMLRNPGMINFLGGCALSLPCHAPGTAPVGLMVAGLAGRDAGLLGIGLGIEKILGQARQR